MSARSSIIMLPARSSSLLDKCVSFSQSPSFILYRNISQCQKMKHNGSCTIRSFIVSIRFLTTSFSLISTGKSVS